MTIKIGTLYFLSSDNSINTVVKKEKHPKLNEIGIIRIRYIDEICHAYEERTFDEFLREFNPI